MHIKFLRDEDFVNYKKCSMFIGAPSCTWKCCLEEGLSCNICQNNPLAIQPTVDFPDATIVSRYINNDLSEAIVFGGLEPMDDFDELLALISLFREKTDDDIVIYTGYYSNEISEKILKLKNFSNIIIKFGRYKPNNKPHRDELLGVDLASDNQYAEKIS